MSLYTILDNLLSLSVLALGCEPLYGEPSREETRIRARGLGGVMRSQVGNLVRLNGVTQFGSIFGESQRLIYTQALGSTIPGCNILCKPTKTKSPNDCPFYDLIKHGLATEVQKAYIAGIVDGEGCITIMRRNTKRKSGIISFYQGLVTVTNTNKKMLDFIAKLYGGWITVNRKPKSSEQTSYNWVCTGNNMRRLLRDIIGYLIVKKKNAKIVLGFPIYEHVGGRSEKQKKEQENLWLLMKGLNHRGVSNAKKCFM